MSAEKTLGDLLVQSGRISVSCLQEIVPLSKQLGMPVRQVLIHSGDISKNQMYAALELFALVGESFMSFESAAKAFRLVWESNLEVSAALEEVGCNAAKQPRLIRLGDMLMQAGCIDQWQLQESLRVSKDAACPLGHSLILLGFVPPAIVGAALTMQQLMRDKTILTSQEAVMRLRDVIDTKRKGPVRA